MIPYTQIFEEIKNYFHTYDDRVSANLNDVDFDYIAPKQKIDFEIEDLKRGSIYVVFDHSGLCWKNGHFVCTIGDLKEIYIYYPNCEEQSFNINDISRLNGILRPQLDNLCTQIEDAFETVLNEVSYNGDIYEIDNDD